MFNVTQEQGPQSVINAGNSTTTPLGIGATYVGTGVDLIGFSSVSYSIFTDQVSALNGIEIQFSPDNINWDTRFSTSVTASRVNKGTDLTFRAHDRYFRIQYTNGAVAQTVFRLQVLLNRYPPAGDTIGIDNVPGSGSDAFLVKSVLTGRVPGSAALYKDVLVDENGALLAKEAGFRGAFGAVLTTSENIRNNVQFQYNINSRIINSVTASGGTVAQSAGKAVLTTGTDPAGSARISSREVIKYTPGQGAIARFTALFTTGVANSRQEIGVGDDNDGFFFGFNGTSFGVLRRQGGVDTWIPQTSWNGPDRFDGTGYTGTTLNPTMGNVYQIQYQWLGFGAIKFYIEDATTGEFVLVHTIRYPNQATTPSILNPTLPLWVKIINTGNTSSLSLSTASMGGVTEGPPVVDGSWVYNSRSSSKTGIPTTGTSMLALQNKATVFGGATNNNRVSVCVDSISIRAATNNDLYIEFRLNPTLTTPTFTDVDVNTSVVAVDTVGTWSAGTGTTLYTISVAGGTSSTINIPRNIINLRPGDTLAAICYSEAATVSARVSVNWHEEF